MMDGHQSSKFFLLIPMDLDVCLIEWYKAYLLKFYQTAAMYCHQVITSDILTITPVYLCGHEPVHLPVIETQGQPSLVLVTSDYQ